MIANILNEVASESWYLTFVNLAATIILILVIRHEHRDTVKVLGRVVHELDTRARVDSLTGALNAAAFEVEGEQAHARAKRYHGGYLLVLDLDNFKDVNDTQGHQAGDRALRTVSAAIQHRLRASDILGRIGGDEFAILVPGDQFTEAEGVANAIRQAIFEAPPPPVTASIGIATLENFSSFQDAMANADQGMYAAKRAGGNRVIQQLGTRARVKRPKLKSDKDP